MFKWLNNLMKDKDTDTNVDFRQLVSNAKQNNSEYAMENIWREFYQLPHIYVLLSPFQNDNSPYCAKLDDKKWLFVFTDLTILKDEAPYILGKKKQVNFVKLSQITALDWLVQWSEKDIYGVRINQGDSGVFSSISDLVERKKYLTDI